MINWFDDPAQWWAESEKMTESMSDEEKVEYAKKTLMYGCGVNLLVFIAMLLLMALLSGCGSTQVVEVERVRTDTVMVTRNIRDSVYLKDSVFVNRYERGETVFVEKERWRTRWVDHLAHDTMYISRVDSVPVGYPVTEYVERELTWWQKARMHTGEAVMLVVVAGGVWGAVRRRFF